MKNIHILPTDKSSRVFITKKEGLGFDNQMLENVELDCQNQNIYITSDEEIKVGDWVIHNTFNSYPLKFERKDGDAIMLSRIDLDGCSRLSLKDCKKIILTTDQDLIKDGVQAINDEFLEWFVKNPSCEYVEVKDVYKTFLEGNKRSVSDFREKYKIIIPKEESKQCELCKRYPRLEGTNKCESCYSVVRHVLEQDPRFKNTLLPDLRKKKETLEEAAERIPKEIDYREFDLASFKLGIRWQETRSYTYEEMKESFSKGYDSARLKGAYKSNNSFEEEWESWAKQFKKEHF